MSSTCGSHDSLATGKRKFHQLHVCSTADSISLWDHFELRADQIQGRGNTEIHIWIDAQIQGQSSAKCEVRPGTHFVTWAPSTDRWVASIREEEGSCVHVCAYVPVYLRLSVCVRIHMVWTTRIWEYEAEIALISKISHASGRTSTNKQRLMDIDVQGSGRKKDKGCQKIMKKISQCELTKAGNRLTIVSVSWFTPLCRSQQFSPVSIALNNSQQFPNLRFPTIFANLRFSSPQIGAQASRHGKQEHFDPH